MNTSKVFLFGLDNAGKTTILHYIKTGDVIDGIKPTRSFNIDNFILNDIDYRVWDAPGQSNYRKIWKKGFDSANILLFVLDTSENFRFEEAKRELLTVLQEPDQKNVPLLFCYHKMDKPDSEANLTQAMQYFRLNEFTNRPVFAYNTTIKSPQSLDQLKERLVELVQKGRW